jgi:hypothetical protein
MFSFTFPVFNMRASRWLFLTLALSLAFGSANNAFSEVYQWKDSKGVVHFADRPVSTDPQVVKEVVVPSPNLANAFKPNPNIREAEEAQTPEQASGATGAVQQPPPSNGIAAKSKDSCQAKVAAYKASKACFDACAKPNGGSGMNTAGCGHCVDQPMPQCWSRN